MDNIEGLVTRLNGLLELQKYTQCMHQEVAKQEGASHNHPSLYPNDTSQQQYMTNNQQYYQTGMGGFPMLGDDISNVFSLKSLRQSLDQGVEKLSSTSDTWKKRLVNEWNGLKLPQPQGAHALHPPQTSYMMDASLFGDDEELLQRQQQQQQTGGAVPLGYPTLANSSHPHPQQPHPNAVATQTAARPIQTAPNGGRAPGTLNHATATTGTHELAVRLGNSVAILQEFVTSVARAPNQNQYASMLPFPNGDAAAGAKVPNMVWEALAEVEAVRTVLLQQSDQTRY